MLSNKLKTIVFFGFLILIILGGCEKERQNKSGSSIKWPSMTEEEWYENLDSFLHIAVDSTETFFTIEKHRGLRYLEAALNLTCALPEIETQEIEIDSFNFLILTNTILIDDVSTEVITGSNMDNLFTDVYADILNKIDTMSMPTGYIRFIKAIDLAWNDPTGEYSFIGNNYVNCVIFVGIRPEEIPPGSEYCVDEGPSHIQFQNCFFTEAWKQVEYALNDPACNPLSCSYTYGNSACSTNVLYLDHTYLRKPFFQTTPSVCLSRSVVEGAFYDAAGIAGSNRPPTKTGSSYLKRILHNFNVISELDQFGDVTWKVDIDYANCYYSCEIYYPISWNSSGRVYDHD